MNTMAQYKNGDIVWVQASKRLGWWPARVEQESKLPTDLKEAVTDKTLCVVKFLNEDNYQIVEEHSIICAYNSNKKEEHISAGMKKYYEKKKVNETSSPFMKFPTDVKQAEYLTGGSPDLVDHERFQPKKSATAQSNYKHIFVDPKSKEVSKVKSPVKATTSSPRSRTNSNKDVNQTVKVNHPRFQGHSDHEVRIRTQDTVPSASRTLSTSSPAVAVAGQSTAGYVCEICAFSTSRLNLMVMHRKSHLNGTAVAGAATSTPPANKVAAQKRPNTTSPTKGKGAKASTPKRARKAAPTKEETSPADLFDQVKRNLEAKEGQDGSTPPAKQTKQRAEKNSATPASSAAATKRTPRTQKTAKTPTSKSPTAENKPVLVNPKKKWLKSSMQSKAEANPEVKIKLMADWSEEEEDVRSPQQTSEAAAAAPTAAAATTAAASSPCENGKDQEPSSKPEVEQPKNDDEKVAESKETSEETTASNGSETGAASHADEIMAGLNAEIDKLNAGLDTAGQNELKENEKDQPETVMTNGDSHVNGIDKRPVKSEEEIRLDVASLLAETSVPVLPDIEGLKAAGQEAMQIIQEEAGSGGGNILMQVEGGETYMVVWESGDGSTNIQEFLAEGVVATDGEGTGTQTLLIDPSSLQANSDLENLFQMAVAAVAPPQPAAAQPPPANQQSNPTT